MPNLTTFGFEFEVATEAEALVQHLFHGGYVPHSHMHRWHCDCDECRTLDDSHFLFKAQTDSSCSGEVISRVLDFRTSASWPGNPFQVLQDAAVECDAEPGMDAGLHVHVGLAPYTWEQNADAAFAFLMWERTLEHMSGGRWLDNRGSNERVAAYARSWLEQAIRLAGHRPSGDRVRQYLARCEPGGYEHRALYEYWQGFDRHTHLNICTGHNTFEYRLWNSTRSAWRLEMFVRTSLALVDPDVVVKMLATNPYHLGDSAEQTLVTFIREAGHVEAADLWDRQFAYLRDRAATAPSTLTTF